MNETTVPAEPVVLFVFPGFRDWDKIFVWKSRKKNREKERSNNFFIA